MMTTKKQNIVWSIQEKQLQLKYTWKISRNSSAFKINFFIKINEGPYEGMGEVAPNIRYGETPELIRQQFGMFLDAIGNSVYSLADLDKALYEITLCNSLRFGIESAFIHYLCNKSGLDVYEFLGLERPGKVPTFYSLPIMPVGELEAFVNTYDLRRFHNLKVKINREDGLELVREAARLSTGPVAVDANEAWTDPGELLLFCEKLKGIDIAFMEQPLPATLLEEYRQLKPLSPFMLMADESVTDRPDISMLSNCFHGINMKLMKAGGYLNGIRIMRETKKHGMKTMCGCMVETSLGISSALNLCSLADFTDLDGFLILEDDPFGLVLEEEGMLDFKKGNGLIT